MNADVKSRWIAALESGDYQQGTGYLKKQGPADPRPRYCCLGVLCELALAEGVITEVDTSVRSEDGASFTYFAGDCALPPPEVWEWAGLESKFGVYGQWSTDTLTYANDRGQTFIEIAGIIREKL